MIAGAGKCDREVVKFVVEEGNIRLRELIDWGINFDKNEEEFHLTKEGGHSEKRIVHNKIEPG